MPQRMGDVGAGAGRGRMGSAGAAPPLVEWAAFLSPPTSSVVLLPFSRLFSEGRRP